MSKKDIQKALLIRAFDSSDDTYRYFAPTERYDKWVKSLGKALIPPTANQTDPNFHEKLFELAVQHLTGDYSHLQNVEMFDVVIGWTKTKKLSDDTAKQIKQKNAISKLSREEIEALGIQEEAALYKLSNATADTTEYVSEEPSMEDILANIRTILSDDDEINSLSAGQSTRVLNQNEIDSLLGFDDDDDEQDDLAAEWKAMMSGE